MRNIKTDVTVIFILALLMLPSCRESGKPAAVNDGLKQAEKEVAGMDLKITSSAEQLLEAMDGHVLAKAELMGTFKK